jgi:hypothetical protein
VLPDGQPLPAGGLRRLCCQAELIPVVLAGPSHVLDVGRAERLVTPDLRVALTARDQGCLFPGCDAPPARGEAHHLRPWWLGEHTNLNNLATCQRTHISPHQRGFDPLPQPVAGRLNEDGQSLGSPQTLRRPRAAKAVSRD